MKSTAIVLLSLLLSGVAAHAGALLKPTTGATQALRAKSLDVALDIDGAFARTAATTIYANPNNGQIEADFIYTAPDDATVTGFAYWFKGEKVVARVVEKERAAQIYNLITVRRRDPALVEMIGKNTFRARIAPVEAGADLKIEVQYIEPLAATPDGWRWDFPLKQETANSPLDSVKFRAQVAGGAKATSNFGEFRDGNLSAEKRDVKDADDIRLAVAASRAPLRISLFAARDSGSDGFFALALVPDFSATKPTFAVSGVQTYDVIRDENARVGQTFVAVGRYRGAGTALVKLGKRSVTARFGATLTPGNIAAPLWGARRIEELSANDKNRAAVIHLSKRFGMPSKWTSWLALPASEKAAFEQQLLSLEIDRAVERWAQSVAIGDKKREVILRQRAYDYRARWNKLTGRTENISAQVFRQALNDELDRVVAARDDKSANKAQLARLDKSLRARGATSYLERESQRERLQRRINLLNRQNYDLYQNSLVARQKGDKKRASQLRKESDVVFAKLQKLGYSYDTRPYILQAQIAPIALEIARERRAGKANSPRQQQLLTQLRRLLLPGNNGDIVLRGAKMQLYTDDLTAAYRDLRSETQGGRGNSDKAVRLKQEIERLKQLKNDNYFYTDVQWVQAAYATAAMEQTKPYVEARAKGDKIKASVLLKRIDALRAQSRAFTGSDLAMAQLVTGGWYMVKEEATLDLAKEIAARREDSPAAANSRARIKRADTNLKSDYGYNDFRLDFAWKGRAHETAYRLLVAREKGDTKLAAQLEAQLKTDAQAAAKNATKYGGNVPLDAYIEWEKSRIERGEPIITSENYVLRPGDPLISVSAPANCQRVVAILPSGELLPLVYDGTLKSWQARFDVPTYADEGAYDVQIVIVEADGARHQMTMTFHVDVTAPGGQGGATWGEDGLNLQLQTDDKTDRVSAFLPWGERIELRRNVDGIFVARAQVPQSWRVKAAIVRFVLTDEAHNRTEISVDWSR